MTTCIEQRSPVLARIDGCVGLDGQSLIAALRVSAFDLVYATDYACAKGSPFAQSYHAVGIAEGVGLFARSRQLLGDAQAGELFYALDLKRVDSKGLLISMIFARRFFRSVKKISMSVAPSGTTVVDVRMYPLRVITAPVPK